MTNLNLEPGESIILQAEGACRYNEDDETSIDELYLTNRHIIYVWEETKGFIFTKSESHLIKIPLSKIAIIDNMPQVKQVKDKDYGKTIQIIYSSGERELFSLYDSPKKQHPVWEAAIIRAVLAAIQIPNKATEKKPQFCSYCGSKLSVNAKFCGSCGAKIHYKTADSSVDSVVSNIAISEDKKQKNQGPITLTIKEKAFKLRHQYTICDDSGNILYTAKSEGLPKMPEIIVYEQDRKVGRIEKEPFANPRWGDTLYSLYWNGRKYASLQWKLSLKPSYKIPEKGWVFVTGVMTSKLYDRNDALLVEIGMIISSERDRYTVKYSNDDLKPAAVLFALVGAMRTDLEK